MPGLGLPDHYLAKLFGPLNNNWLGRSNSALLALADWRVEVRRLLHAVFLAGLQSIPASTREAALMEGASRTRVFREGLRCRCCADAELCYHHRAGFTPLPRLITSR